MTTIYHVYSSMLGGYLSMDYKKKEDAEDFIKDYHCKIEKRQMKVLEEGKTL